MKDEIGMSSTAPDTLYPVPGGQWAISRLVDGVWVFLIQGRPIKVDTIPTLLRYVGLDSTEISQSICFPHDCPSFDFMCKFYEQKFCREMSDPLRRVGV